MGERAVVKQERHLASERGEDHSRSEAGGKAQPGAVF
jgi:hypothetical protein